MPIYSSRRARCAISISTPNNPTQRAYSRQEIDVPIFHLPQLLGLAFGMEPEQLRLNHHVVSTKGVVEKVELKV